MTEPDADKIKNTWDSMRGEERRERDEKIQGDLEQTEQLAQTLAPEPD